MSDSRQALVLRAVGAADSPTVERWLDQKKHRPLDSETLLVLALKEDATPIGLTALRPNDPADGWLTIASLFVTEEHRGTRLESEAVLVVEAEATRRFGARRFRALVRHDDGLALYFWLRLGYVPPSDDERSQACQDGSDIIYMTRHAA
jgi:RimJ/RimL family protein N-acetyltransferase